MLGGGDGQLGANQGLQVLVNQYTQLQLISKESVQLYIKYRLPVIMKKFIDVGTETRISEALRALLKF